jgi:hypothetical protein
MSADERESVSEDQTIRPRSSAGAIAPPATAVADADADEAAGTADLDGGTVGGAGWLAHA